MSFSAENLRSKLAGVNETQEGISSVAQWILFHKRHANTAAQVWAQSLNDAPVSQKLAHIYVVNEVVQQARIRKKDEFVRAFSETLSNALSNAYKQVPAATQKRIDRVVAVWRDRSVFSGEVLSDLEQSISYSNNTSYEPKATFSSASSFFSTTSSQSPGSHVKSEVGSISSRLPDLTLEEPFHKLTVSWSKINQNYASWTRAADDLISGFGRLEHSAESIDKVNAFNQLGEQIASSVATANKLETEYSDIIESIDRVKLAIKNQLDSIRKQKATLDETLQQTSRSSVSSGSKPEGFLVSPAFEPLTDDEDAVGAESDYVPKALRGSPDSIAQSIPQRETSLEGEEEYVPYTNRASAVTQSRDASDDEQEYVPRQINEPANKKAKVELSADVADFLASMSKS